MGLDNTDEKHKYRKLSPNKKKKKIFERGKIAYHLDIAQPDWTDKQKTLLDLIRDPNIKTSFVIGPAGTAKTFTALSAALEMLNAGEIFDIVLVRTIVESSMISLGTLPGNSDEKLGPFIAPFLEKFAELISPEDLKKLVDDKRIHYVPVNHLRGRQFNKSVIIADEVQNFTMIEIFTLLTRLGKESKMILAGDVAQVDYFKSRVLESGLRKFYDWYDKPEFRDQGINCFKFGLEDVMREPIIKLFIEQFDKMRAKDWV